MSLSEQTLPEQSSDPFERFPNQSFAGRVLFPEEGSGRRAILLDGDELSPEARDWLEKFLGR